MKSTKELVKLCVEGLDQLSENGPDEKYIEDVELTIQAIKNILLGKPISQLKKKTKIKLYQTRIEKKSLRFCLPKPQRMTQD